MQCVHVAICSLLISLHRGSWTYAMVSLGTRIIAHACAQFGLVPLALRFLLSCWADGLILPLFVRALAATEEQG